MANIKVGLSKKSTVILLLLFFVLTGGGGGYLLWRVNQAKTVAPTDSDASGGTWSCSPKFDVVYYLRDGTEKKCNACTSKSDANTGAGCPFDYTYECGQYCFPGKTPCGEEACNNIGNPAPTVTLAYKAGAGGTIEGQATQTFTIGGDGTEVTAKPNSGFKFGGWNDNHPTAQRRDRNVKSSVTYTASFTAEAVPHCNFTYKVATGGGGSLTGTTTQKVDNGESGTPVTAAPASTHVFVKWEGDSNQETAGVAKRTDSCSNTNVSTPVNKTFTAVFKKKDVPVVKYDLTYKTDGNGSVDKAGPHKVNADGQGPKVTATAKKGFKFSQWQVIEGAGKSVPAGLGSSRDGTKSWRVDTKIKAKVTVKANFKKACGDNVCDSWENMTNCPADCKGCGDGKCVAPENAEKCPKDCKAKCGDGFCTHDENAKTCPGDCKAVCGDKFCTHDENAETCPEDCKAKCGDNICSPSENAQTCPQDCPVNCGDGICSEDENPEKCPADCPSVCGDGMCTGGESSADCPDDCGSPVVGEVVPETGIFDDSRHTMIFGAVVLVVGIAWTWIATLPKKVIHTVSSVSSAISSTNDKLKRKKLTRERDSRRSKLEKRIK